MAKVFKDHKWIDTKVYFSLYIDRENREGIRRIAPKLRHTDGTKLSMSSLVNEFLTKVIKEYDKQHREKEPAREVTISVLEVNSFF